MSLAPLSRSYLDARAAFVAAATGAGAHLTSFPHPLVGPDGEGLAVDVAELGPGDAAHTVLVVSATHGVEGFCGSALQRHWLEEHADTRADSVRVVLIHGLNPYGFAWVRRVNEDNVDLNRNFIDWQQPVPATPEYQRIARLLVPEAWDEAEQARTFAAIVDVLTEMGMERLQAIISGGQYEDPTGVFYGGTGPVWSHRWLQEWAADHLRAVDRLTVIDLHTGLGPWGHGELIVSVPSRSEQYGRATALWGEVRSMLDGDSVSAVLNGDWLNVVDDLVPGARVTAVALEFGTVDPISVLQALRADAWLHAHGDPRGAESAAIRAQVRAAFADDDPSWLQQVCVRFLEVMGPAVG